MTQTWHHKSLDLHTYRTKKLQLTDPKLCYFCDKTGHIKKEYHEYKASVELREMQKERKLQRAQEHLAMPSMEVDKEVKVEDQTAETSASYSEEIKVEINPIFNEVDISQKSAIEDPLASFYTKDNSTKGEINNAETNGFTLVRNQLQL
ncbi:hypothetical protein C2G38_2040604 [Gigaspora rosea]|uniref:Uncharacterized protein n=1 Tax=Gigaspora rosea TaxID=44941 RepID=A0A397V1W4_9GLOM|nr:hypothetical protein C2G38_2040604 [Gigaspora rosea]